MPEREGMGVSAHVFIYVCPRFCVWGKGQEGLFVRVSVCVYVYVYECSSPIAIFMLIIFGQVVVRDDS